jgi:osmotically-inducible protein OsmY
MLVQPRHPLLPAALILAAAAAPGPAATETDERIIAAARGSYNFRVYLKDDRVAVASRNGAVTLTGAAKSKAEKDLVTRIARNIQGIRMVRNRMTAEGW